MFRYIMFFPMWDPKVGLRRRLLRTELMNTKELRVYGQLRTFTEHEYIIYDGSN